MERIILLEMVPVPALNLPTATTNLVLEIRHAYFAGFIHSRAVFSDGHFDCFANKRRRFDGDLQRDDDSHANEQRNGDGERKHERPAELRGLIGDLRTRIHHCAIGNGAYQRDGGRE